MPRFFRPFVAALLCLAATAQATPPWGIEQHDRLLQPAASALSGAPLPPQVAITLDACGGGFDADLIATLVRQAVPATVFLTQKWMDRNPVGLAALLAHPELFDLQDHGTQHVPAVVGAGRRVYGLPGVGSVAQLNAEVSGAAQTIQALTGRKPVYFRGATAVYDEDARRAIQALGYRIAGFSVNADAGATLAQPAIEQRLRQVKAGDVVIAHMNKPAGRTAEAFAAALPELKARGVRFVTLSQAQLQAY
jgi:peptidoglycan/xylan/chitin deacetylase (PgdA/CDA1 family)